MTKRIYIFLFILSATIIWWFFFHDLRKEFLPSKPLLDKVPSQQKSTKNENTAIKIDGKKVVGLISEDKEKGITISNYVSADWEELLQAEIRYQAGKSLKEFRLQKVDSFILYQDGVALHVESVIIFIKNDQNLETSFRVLVDAQNGKILKNWDQPVFDTINPKEKFKIKIDPRYHDEVN